MSQEQHSQKLAADLSYVSLAQVGSPGIFEPVTGKGTGLPSAQSGLPRAGVESHHWGPTDPVGKLDPGSAQDSSRKDAGWACCRGWYQKRR